MLKTTSWAIFGLACVTVSAAGCGEGEEQTEVATAALSGAIFTTLADGGRVNANIYDFKEDVYLDGGPGDGAPAGAAALDPGDYYFMVTSPSGKTLLSTDGRECRRFTVSADGVITALLVDGCAAPHITGQDQDHSELGAITVRLMPYDNTPNNGGEYKVWVTKISDYDEEGNGNKWGFVPADSKTDNFKVRHTTPRPPCCGDGIKEGTEECDDGNLEDGDGCSSECTNEEAHCGDEIIQGSEQCDDGNLRNGDGCSSVCELEDHLW